MDDEKFDNEIEQYLTILGLESYASGIKQLHQKFTGTEEWLEDNANNFDKTIIDYLKSMDIDSHQSLHFMALRRSPVLLQRFTFDGIHWDFRCCSFSEFQQTRLGLVGWNSYKGFAVRLRLCIRFIQSKQIKPDAPT